jgi:hypothetical protein
MPVPASTFFDILEDGGSADQFMEFVPGVALAQVRVAYSCFRVVRLFPPSQLSQVVG